MNIRYPIYEGVYRILTLQLLGKFVHILYFFCFRFFIYWETGTLKCQFMHCVNRSIHPDSLSG